MARAATLTAIGALGFLAAFDPPFSRGDEPIHTGQAATVYRTVTETRLVDRRVDGLNAAEWRARAIGNKRRENVATAKAAKYNTRLITATRAARRRWAPTVRYALELARAVYGVDQTRRARCESTLTPGAVSPGGHMGLLQFLGSTWRSTPFAGFSPFDPVAASLAGGWMVRAGRSGEWSCPL